MTGDLSIEFALRVFLSALVRLVDCDGYEPCLEQFDNVGLGEGRLTVEYTVVSGAAQRMAVHRPNEDGLFLFNRSALGVQ